MDKRKPMLPLMALILTLTVAPATPSRQDSTDAVATDRPEPSPAPVATVLGKAVEVPGNTGRYKGRHVRQVVFKTLMEAHVTEHELSASPDEVDAALAVVNKQQKALRTQRKQRRDMLVAELKSPELSENRRKEGSKYLERLNELIENDEKEAQEEDSQEYRDFQRQFIKWGIETWRFDKALYSTYGGRVIFGRSPWSLLEPIGAYGAWLKEQESKKSFEVFDPGVREELYDYFEGDRSDLSEQMVRLCFEKDRPFNLWTEAEQTDWHQAGQDPLVRDGAPRAQRSVSPDRPQAGDVVTNSIGMKLVYVPAGEFMMGSPSGEVRNAPPHRVRISQGFYIGICEVTQAQWKAVMETDLMEQRDRADTTLLSLSEQGSLYPMYYVSWEEADEFCRQLSQREARRYRLPTEAEWEYACRAGTTTRFSFGDDETLYPDYAWLPMNSGGQVRAVGWKKPNGWGLYDVHGNVCEWCSDWFGRDYYSKSPSTDPPGPSTGQRRVFRGGCWIFTLGNSRSAERLAEPPDCRSDAIGFRVVLDHQK